jgi:NTP pyrophosphatase (non-canonical NTP hydrolase)
MREITLFALQRYGANHQLLKLAEECSELSAAIVRGIGDTRRKTNFQPIIEEAADVAICLEYVRHVFGNTVLDEAIKEKLERLTRRLSA